MVKRMASDAAPAVTSPGKRQRMEATEGAQQDGRAMPVALQPSVRLTATEEKLFAFLLAVAAQEEADGAVLRVAGGWVRDKLLGRDSDDVDIVLDRMKGRAFAELVNAYEATQGRATHAVGVIKANPEQSKHLETATMQLGDDLGWVDFVNLRAETYSSEDNRIPDVQLGTPLQDAERRDFTINSLFYNISERQVEDFTQRGLADLRRGLIRTPLEPRVTFLDDPLRVLRAVRFASRFNFALDADLRAAAQLEEVNTALVRKVSRERVGKELTGMITGSAAHPARALRLLHELRLCSSIFLPSALLETHKTTVCRPDGSPHTPTTEEEDAMWDQGYSYASEMHRHLSAASPSTAETLDVDGLSEEARHELKVSILAAFLLPFRGFYLREKRRRSVAAFVIHEALKLPNREIKDVDGVILAHVDELQAAVKTAEAGFDRTQVGLLLRGIGANWTLCRDVALVQELVACGAHGDGARDAVSRRYDAFSRAVEAAGLLGVWDLKPLLNGKDLVKQLGVKPGPKMKELLDRVMVWQLSHPQQTRAECLAHFQALLAAEAHAN